jgi:hypothetical protein
LFDINPWSRKKPKKQIRRENVARNAEQGRMHQNFTEMSYAMQGYKVERRRTGCDFEATRHNPFTGRTEHLYVEAKSSPTAPMREKQESMRKKKRSHYRVERGGFLW